MTIASAVLVAAGGGSGEGGSLVLIGRPPRGVVNVVDYLGDSTAGGREPPRHPP
ncbi:hypothetical protein [Candidatus Frankia nodulisporulans]|uniref:hypothetical protein n=1 Tax=Candidatus Frankia nodulisporulans TaxID=2060052 RepID=UPI0013D7A9A1|nr:hypothetical protein [Candidatus Frankia nodulisporulans]